VTAPDPERDRTAGSADYLAAVEDWQGRRAAGYRRMISLELPDGGTGGFLVWGDPAVYDGTLRILQRIAADTPDRIEIIAVPGISSLQALAARHRIALNRTGRAFLVTTGRRLADEGMPAGVDDVVVMLDARQAFATLPDTDLDIYWGAYLGTPDELLVYGDLQQVKEQIRQLWAEHRSRKGWIMDSYLLRRRLPG
jgi:precorrin-6A synthase